MRGHKQLRKNIVLIDANVVLRYLLGDNEEHYLRSIEIIENNHVSIRIEVLSEIVYVLKRLYKTEKKDIRDCLRHILLSRTVYIEKREAVLMALDCYAKNNIDFVDALLWAYHATDGEVVFTFDKKLNQLLLKNNCRHPHSPT